MDDGVEEGCNKTLSNINCSDSDHHELQPEAVAVPLVFVLIFIIGIFGNILLLCSFIKHKTFGTPHNVFVINLAIGDLVILFVSLPFNATWYYLLSWPYGEAICKLSHFAETLGTAVSVFTLTILSIERYMIISGRHRSSRRRFSPAVILAFVWMTSLYISIPDLISAVVESPKSHTGKLYYCLAYTASWGQDYPKIITAVRFVLLFVIPLAVIFPFYVLIFCSVISKATLTQPTSSTPLKGDNRQLNVEKEDKKFRKRKSFAITVFCLVLVFILCWLPRHTFLIWYYFDPGLFNEFWHGFKIIGFCLVFANSALNPLIFLLLDSRYKRFVKRIITCKVSTSRILKNDRALVEEQQTIVMADIGGNVSQIDFV
ncbi:neuropeptide CCHamide-1 receptor-like [Haliotis cracherodii]|uniref:neuropeptide CCHamide-1 receptor-like n=1 Tax=Haliotis cracherodii TaxID=6455 RepID=UPI0039ED7616